MVEGQRGDDSEEVSESEICVRYVRCSARWSLVLILHCGKERAKGGCRRGAVNGGDEVGGVYDFACRVMVCGRGRRNAQGELEGRKHRVDDEEKRLHKAR
jgi:hypothetical protein